MKLTPIEPEDLELLYTIENNPAVWAVSGTTAPYSRYALRDYIANQQADIYADRQLRLVIGIEDSVSPSGSKAATVPGITAVGLIDLFNFEPLHLRAELGVAILREHQGKGYAVEAIRQLADYSRNVLHLHQLYCIVPTDNSASLTMLRKAGFTHETPLKDWIQTTDGWQDAVHMQLFL